MHRFESDHACVCVCVNLRCLSTASWTHDGVQSWAQRTTAWESLREITVSIRK